MFRRGLVSVSFRALPADEVIVLARAAGLTEIEWGGDVHVPAGDLAAARAVGEQTKSAGLSVAAYGSYYRLGASPQEEFAAVLDTAQTLGAPLIRIWAGTKGSDEVSADAFRALTSEAVQLCAQADARGMKVVFECHNGTLTDDYRSALRLLDADASPACGMYWQPNQYRTEQYNLEAASALAPFVTNLHVFHWDETARYPLAQGADIWRRYLDIFRASGGDYGCLLEFMPDNAPASLAQEAGTLAHLTGN